LYAFDSSDDIKIIAKKFNLFVVGNYHRYYQVEPALFHAEMIENYIKAYREEFNYLNIGFRGCAKTTLKKLFDVYTLLNDIEHTRKFYKVMTKDIKNSKQIVTDVYNLIVEVSDLYGDVFEKEGKKKREESMVAFTLKNGVRYAGGTVGQTQRGQVQDAYRPDFVWFEDCEDSSTIRSMVQTQTIIDKSDEAIQGMSDDGNYVITANYISEEGFVQWLINKKNIHTQITPIINKKGEPTWNKYTKDKIQQVKDDAEDWEGDYLCDPTSGKDKFFDPLITMQLLDMRTEPLKEIDFIKIWENYDMRSEYGIGGDTSEGVGEDSNALALFNFSKNAIIGTYHSNEIAPDDFGFVIGKLGRLYGECIVAPEKNNTGHATIAALKQMGYDNIYKEKTTDETWEKQTEKLGWNTNRKTKPQMWFDFKADYDRGVIKIYDKDLLDEISHYTKADFNDRTTGVITRHFDLLTAAVIGWQMRSEVIKTYTDLKSNY